MSEFKPMVNDFLTKALEVRKEVIQRQDEYQLELVREINDVIYINDSKSIRLSSTRYSLACIDAPVILIIGGSDKENDYSSLIQLIRKKVKVIIYLGEDQEKIIKLYSKEAVLFIAASSLEEAVNTAYICGRSGDAVLFSPACPEYKQHDKNRGSEFKRLVNEIKI